MFPPLAIPLYFKREAEIFKMDEIKTIVSGAIIAYIAGLVLTTIGFRVQDASYQLALRKPYFPPIPNPAAEVIDAFPGSQLEGMKQSVSGKKMALELITTYDYNDAFKWTKVEMRCEFASIPEYVLYCQKVSSRDELFNALRDYSLIKPIDALILSFHGSRTGIDVAEDEQINVYNASCFNSYSPLFAEDAVVLLDSCKTGEGESNIATHIADALGVDVIAPRYVLSGDARITADESGRPTFNSDKLVLFKRIRVDCDEGDFVMNRILPESFCGCKDAIVDEAQSGQNAFLFVDK